MAALGAAPASRFVADMKAGVTEIRRRLPGKKVAATGFCFGGGMTWLLLTSKESRLAAAVPFYGPFPEGGNLAGAKAAVLGIYAELDSRVNASRPAARAALRKAGLRHQIVTYPGRRPRVLQPDQLAARSGRGRGRLSPDGGLVRHARCELRDAGDSSWSVARGRRGRRYAAGGTSSTPRSASASIPSRREADLTTSLRRATEASGTRRRDRASSAGSTRRPAGRGTSRSETARRRTVSSSAPTAPRGSPTAGSTRSSGSTRRRGASAASRCPLRRATPT